MSPAPEHHNSKENGLYMKLISYEHTGCIFVIDLFGYQWLMALGL